MAESRLHPARRWRAADMRTPRRSAPGRAAIRGRAPRQRCEVQRPCSVTCAGRPP